jgi:hypothetical protein
MLTEACVVNPTLLALAVFWFWIVGKPAITVREFAPFHCLKSEFQPKRLSWRS